MVDSNAELQGKIHEPDEGLVYQYKVITIIASHQIKCETILTSAIWLRSLRALNFTLQCLKMSCFITQDDMDLGNSNACSRRKVT